MNTATLQDIQRDPLSLVSRVEGGESIVLTRGGTPVAELRPIATVPATIQRPFGLAAGQFTVPDDFDTPLPEETLREFEG